MTYPSRAEVDRPASGAAPDPEARRATSRHTGAIAFAVVFFLVGAGLAMSVDVPRTGYGIKGDEATYVAAALRAAYDGKLSCERQDLARFAGHYHTGPEGSCL